MSKLHKFLITFAVWTALGYNVLITYIWWVAFDSPGFGVKLLFNELGEGMAEGVLFHVAFIPLMLAALISWKKL